MTFWLPETEAALAQVERTMIVGRLSRLVALPYAQDHLTRQHTRFSPYTSFRTLSCHLCYDGSSMSTEANARQGGDRVDFVAVVDQAIALLRQRGRVTYRTLQLQLQLDEAHLEILKEELIEGQRLAVDEAGRVLVWTGVPALPPLPAAGSTARARHACRSRTRPHTWPRKFSPPAAPWKGNASRSRCCSPIRPASRPWPGTSTLKWCTRSWTTALRLLTAEVHRFEGTINQYTGDGVMALFGAPIAHEDSPRRAVHAALGMQRALQDFGRELQAQRGLRLQMRIGMNTGLVVVGKIGDDLRMDYTAVGDTTNLAARLQQLAEPGTVVISEATHRAGGGLFRDARPGGARRQGASGARARL